MNLNKIYKLYFDNEKVNDIYDMLKVEDISEMEFICKCQESSGVICGYEYEKIHTKKRRTYVKPHKIIELFPPAFRSISTAYYLDSEKIDLIELLNKMELSKHSFQKISSNVHKMVYNGLNITIDKEKYIYTVVDTFTKEKHVCDSAGVGNITGVTNVAKQCIQNCLVKKRYKISRKKGWYSDFKKHDNQV